MFDDGAGRGLTGEFGHQFVSRIGIVDVVVGELLALHLACARNAEAALGRAIEGGSLMRILAIAQRFDQAATERPEGRGVVAELGCKPV